MIMDFRAESFAKPRTDGKVLTAFQEMPVRITIGDVDLLSSLREPGWRPLPVVHVAKWGLYSIERAREIGQYVYELGWNGDTGTALLFKMSDGNILVYSTLVEKAVRISYVKLLKEWEAFADRVRSFVLHDFPETTEAPMWGEWLINKEYIPSEPLDLELFPTWRQWFDENPHAFEHLDTSEE